MKVYVVMNESVYHDAPYPILELVSISTTLQKALDRLADIAGSAGVELAEGETSVYLPPNGIYESDEYYIEEREAD